MFKKSTIIFSLVFATGMSPLFAIAGFGVVAGQNSLVVPAIYDSQGSGAAMIELSTTELAEPYSLGAYLYIDALPFIDLEVDAQLVGAEYGFSFSNEYVDLPDYNSYWGGASVYGTVRKKVFGLGLPLLGGVKLHAGGGMNFHTFSPMMNFDNVEELMGGDITSNTTFSEDDLVEWVKDNAVSKNGYHVQGGIQFKLFVIDAFLVYRQVFGDFEDIIDGNSFSNLSLRLGFGF